MWADCLASFTSTQSPDARVIDCYVALCFNVPLPPRHPTNFLHSRQRFSVTRSSKKIGTSQALAMLKEGDVLELVYQMACQSRF